MKIETYDTTLRDGVQGEGVSFSLKDQLDVVQALDALGITFIEGGQPGSNPKARAFFQELRHVSLKTTRIVAFGATRKPRTTPGRDALTKDLLRAETEAVMIVGKSWDFHVDKVLHTSLTENLRMIEDTVAYCVKRGRTVLYDAEHFFDGYLANPQYAIKTLQAAAAGGACRLVLCDTNGGRLPWEVGEIVDALQEHLSTPLGIHVHDDADLSTANTITAVAHGVTHVQGTINGVGERCGNADLTAIIPTLQLKLGMQVVTRRQLRNLTRTAHLVAELANQTPNMGQAYVGQSAFTHKGGWHVHAVQQDASTYEHIEPDLVGNERRILVSEVSGRRNIEMKAAELGIDLDGDGADAKAIMLRVKELEAQGYTFEGAEASLELEIAKLQRRFTPFFELLNYRVTIEHFEDDSSLSEVRIRLRVEDEVFNGKSEGHGPVDALNLALREALEPRYPVLKHLHLEDYKVRILATTKAGTDAKTRVLIESGDKRSGDTWNTVGVDENVLVASYKALVDSIEYMLTRQGKHAKPRRGKRRAAAK